MGYLNKSTITVDAILTNRGRELLAQGGVGSNSSFSITKFAVADDEVDYGLYNTAHPQGSEYYGFIIENMPVLEATPDEQQTMRYKLVSLDQLGTAFLPDSGEIIIPSIQGAVDATLTATGGQPNNTEKKIFSTNPEYTESYTMLVADARLINIYRDDTTGKVNAKDKINANGSITISIPAGRSVEFERIEGRTGETVVTVFGDSTGATATFTITSE